MRGVWLALALAACTGDDDDAPRDAGPDADAMIATAPVAPEPPRLTPCPDGFAPLERCGLATCDPRPADVVCADGEVQLLGEGECGPIGRCVDGFPTPDGPAFYVDAAADPEGDGSRRAPFRSIADALDATPIGGNVLIARGTYSEALVIDREVELSFACPVATFVDAGSGVALDVRADATVHGATFVGGAGIVVREGATLTLREARIDHRFGTGIAVEAGATLDAERVSIFDTDLSQPGGEGILVEGGTATLRAVEVLFSRNSGVHARTGANVTLDRVRIALTNDEETSAALLAEGSDVLVRRSLLEHNERVAVLAREGAALQLEDTVVRDTNSDDNSGLLGNGIIIQGADATLLRVVSDRNRGVGISATDAVVVLEDVLSCATLGYERLSFLGVGIGIYGPMATFDRVAIRQSRVIGLAVNGATIDARDFEIADTTTENVDGTVGRGMAVENGSMLTMSRVRIVRAQDIALAAFRSQIHLEDAEISDTRFLPCAGATCADLPGGFGVGVYASSNVSLERFAIRDARICGVQIAGGTLTLTSGEVAECGVGACLQSEGIDVEALQRSVRYVDNGASLDATELPVPSPAL